MFIELIDSLRCTQPHADTWLVASIADRDDRIVRAGTLGCPICAREYPIAHGIAWFGVMPETRADVDGAPQDSDQAMLLGALLAATEGASIAVTGEWTGAAVALAALLPMRVFIVNPDRSIDESERIGVIRSSEGIPLAPTAMRGIALDVRNATPRDVASAIRVLAPGGRLAAPAEVPIPPELAEIVRDEHWWVAEKRGPLVSLHRR